jgi:hypothetical protein
MSASAIKEKNQRMAADLVRRGYYHGRRASVGLSAFPVDEPGSAAYRRLQRSKRVAAKK